jgi:hypothetical protein
MDVLETLKRIGGYYHFRGPTGRQRKNEYLACKVVIDRFVAAALQGRMARRRLSVRNFVVRLSVVFQYYMSDFLVTTKVASHTTNQRI